MSRRYSVEEFIEKRINRLYAEQCKYVFNLVWDYTESSQSIQYLEDILDISKYSKKDTRFYIRKLQKWQLLKITNKVNIEPTSEARKRQKPQPYKEPISSIPWAKINGNLMVYQECLDEIIDKIGTPDQDTRKLLDLLEEQTNPSTGKAVFELENLQYEAVKLGISNLTKSLHTLCNTGILEQPISGLFRYTEYASKRLEPDQHENYKHKPVQTITSEICPQQEAQDMANLLSAIQLIANQSKKNK